MMQIVYFSSKDRFLAEIATREGELTFIAPSPLKADGLRSRLGDARGKDVITIAKFTAELVNVLWESDPPVVKRKADLLLIFGVLKNKYFPSLGYEQFTQAYNLFSDLRSFTLDEEALVPVLDEQPEEIKRAIGLFWRLLEVTGYLDEHGAYQKITEALRSSEEKEALKKSYVFWGFQHLNGQQVDLLKALAIRYNVIVPFPLALKDRLRRTDWPTWLMDASVQEIVLDDKVKPAPASVAPAQWFTINSRENSSALKGLLQDGDQIVLGVSKLSPLHIDFVPSKKVFFKVPHQVIGAEISQISAKLKDIIIKSDVPLDLKEILASLKDPKDFKLLKALQLYEEALGFIDELTDEALRVDSFFLKLLNEVVLLNQPRTSYVPMSSEELTIDLLDMSRLEDVDHKRRVILCIDERFEDVQGLGQNYTEVIQKALGAIGPLKRNELELHFKHWEFTDLFSKGEVIVLMSEGTLKHSLVWKRLFNGIELTKVRLEVQHGHKGIVDHFKGPQQQGFEGNLSASKLQAFIDCPRKFYFSYVEKVFPSVALEKDFDPLSSGTIIHRIIEVYHKSGATKKYLPVLTAKIMDEFIAERGLRLSIETYLQRRLIFNHRAMNGINFLEAFAPMLGNGLQWTMEEDFDFTEDYRMKGKIDCLGVSDKYVLLLDFKSTKSSASTNKEVEELESVQLWTYAKAASTKISLEGKSVVLGYVVLDNPAESNLLLTDVELATKVKESRLCRIKIMDGEFSDLLKAASDKLVTLSLAIKGEKDFPARPRKSQACHYCELTNVCVKSELKDV
jgi:hypothetical protein